MFELIHKLHVIFNEVKGLEAGYSSSSLDGIFVRIGEKTVFQMELTEIGDIKTHDMFDEFDKLPTVKNQTTFTFAKRVMEVLDVFKGFATGYTVVNMETFFFEYETILYKAKIIELGEGTIQEHMKEVLKK
ncbi:hypothetical protein CVD28_02600 [Bacillus sp. M6-12]|uniref:hypothetical protein n=1 Tax=Bacillus sp. M6-12 TaxID=2054166 RepID=UPI000C78FCA5|nr:hypothetical protein [Bacillus sp. M6-12]PLS19322.1 hypothetical protein CVD28_02600 [Bacillus sp. M6-12]